MRKLALALAIVGAALSLADYLGWRERQARLLALAAEAAPPGRLPPLTAGLRRQTVPERTAALLAWRLMRLEIDRQWLAELPESLRADERRRGLDRLRLAARLAAEALDRQPASWRAAAVIGATRYLESSRLDKRDRPVADWREPLRAAIGLAPGAPDPPRILASFYLSRWSSLAPDQRDELPPLLARAFEEPSSLRRLLPTWMRLAPSLERLLEPIPDRPAAWLELGRQFLAQGDLERFAMSHRRRLEALPKDLAARLEAGRARLAGGHERAGLGLLRSILATPPDLAWADSFAAALDALPDDALAADQRADLAAWASWARDLCEVGRCPLTEAVMERLERLAGPPPVAAPETAGGVAAGESWPADLWRRRGAAFRLALDATRPARRIRLEIARVPPAGAAIELAWDGTVAGVVALQPGEPLSWPLEVGQGEHLLQVRHLSGRPLLPALVSLEPDRPAI